MLMIAVQASGRMGLLLILRYFEPVFQQKRAWARFGVAEQARRQASEVERGRYEVRVLGFAATVERQPSLMRLAKIEQFGGRY